MLGSFVDPEDVERRIPPKRRFNFQRTTWHCIQQNKVFILYYKLRRHNYIVIYLAFFWELIFLYRGAHLFKLPETPLFLSTTTWYDSVFTAQIIPGSAPEFRCQQDVSSKIIRSVWLIEAGRYKSYFTLSPNCQCLCTELIVRVVVCWDEVQIEFKSATWLLVYTK
jgi:hypothetical protein